MVNKKKTRKLTKKEIIEIAAVTTGGAIGLALGIASAPALIVVPAALGSLAALKLVKKRLAKRQMMDKKKFR